MSMLRKTTPRFAVCINNSEYPVSLELHKIYRVLPDEEAASDGDLRVIDESGEDYFCPAEYFVLIEVPQQVERSYRPLESCSGLVSLGLCTPGGERKV